MTGAGLPAIIEALNALGPFAALNSEALGPFLGMSFGPPGPQGARESVHVVNITGPLLQNAITFGGKVYWQGHDVIAREIVSAAQDPAVDAMVLRINSPGGSSAGMFDGAREARAAIEASGKPVIADVRELAASAGYAWATVADEIHLPMEGQVGSIGTWVAHYDWSRALDRMGITATLIADPDGKVAGHPDVPLSADAKAEIQDRISFLTATFAEFAGQRRGQSADRIRALNARMLTGQKAIDAGLADAISTTAQVMARAAELGRARKESRMSDKVKLLALAGISCSATAPEHEIEKAATEAAPVLALGREAMRLTGAKTPAEAEGALKAWSALPAQVAEANRKEAQEQAAREVAERIALCQQLVVKKGHAPAGVWTSWDGKSSAKMTTDDGKTTLMPVPGLAAMGIENLRGYVAGLPDKLAAFNEAQPAGHSANDGDVEAYAKKHKVQPFIARAALEVSAREGEV